MVPQKLLSKENGNTLYLLDISSFIFRAFFAIRSLTSPKGEPTNAVYGVASMLAKLVDEADPVYLGVTYDSKEASFREEIYPEYKANRSAAPDDLVPQFARIDQLISKMGMHSFRAPGFEADDLIATLTEHWCQEDPEHRVVIVTGDKDLMALVTDRVSIWDTMNGKVYTPTEVEEKFGVRPNQIQDYLSLVGDSSDNIPGVAGIGPKSAVDLLKEFKNLDGVLDAAKAGKVKGKKGETLKEQESLARLSHQLVCLKSDVPVHFGKKDFKYHFQVQPDLVEFLSELGFGSLVKKWSASTTAANASPTTTDSTSSAEATALVATKPGAPTFHTVDTQEKLDLLLSKMEKHKEFGFDLETTSLDPQLAQIVGIAIAVDLHSGYYIPVGHKEGLQLEYKDVIKQLRPYLEDPRYKKVGQNLKYDWSILRAHGIHPDGIGADTMVASYVVEVEGRHNLETLAAQYLNYTVVTYEEVCGKGKTQISFADVPIEKATHYSGEDAWVALALWDVLKKKLVEMKLMPVFAEIDLPLVPVLSQMELEGIMIDVAWLKKLSHRFEEEIQAIEKKVLAFVPKTDGEPLNLNSPKQLAKLLFEDLKLPTQSKTKTGYSTDASVLEALADQHEVPRLLLEFREIAKLKGTYVDPLPELRSAKDGKIHTSFHQTVAATGRLSSSDPNLQNIPIRSERGKLIRKAFVASEGNLLVSADYSQIELRILAHMSADKELVNSFNRNEDVHARTAAEIYGGPPEDVSDEQRAVAKAINFGLMYGKTPFGLAQELHIPRKEAQEMIGRYFERYSGVKSFLDGQIEQAREKGFVTTLFGRRRTLRDINSKNPSLRGFAERMAMNTPIQGTASDLIKIAMVKLDERLAAEKFKARLILQVHDELVLDCPEKEVPKAEKLLTEVMESAHKLSVPLSVNVSHGWSWDTL